MEDTPVQLLEWEASDRKVTVLFMVSLVVIIWLFALWMFEFKYSSLMEAVSVKYRVFMWSSLLVLFISWAFVFESFEFRLSELSDLVEKRKTEPGWKSIAALLFWLFVLGALTLVDWHKIISIKLAPVHQISLALVGLMAIFYFAVRILNTERRMEDLKKRRKS